MWKRIKNYLPAKSANRFRKGKTNGPEQIGLKGGHDKKLCPPYFRKGEDIPTWILKSVYSTKSLLSISHFPSLQTKHASD